MSVHDIPQRYGKYITGILYPAVGGLVIAMLVSSIFLYINYRPVIEKPVIAKTGRVRQFNLNLAVTEILNKNVFRIKVVDKASIKGRAQIASIENIRLLGVFLGERSIAVLKSADELLYLTEGEQISGYRVVSIEFDRVKLKKGKREFVLTFPETGDQLTSRGPEKDVQKQRENKSDSKARIVIKRNEVIERSRDLNKLLTTMRIIPYYRRDEFLGYQLAMLKKGSFFYKLGLRAGDIIERVNGEDVSSPERLVEMLSRLESITAVNIDLIRRGKKKTIFIEIED